MRQVSRYDMTVKFRARINVNKEKRALCKSSLLQEHRVLSRKHFLASLCRKLERRFMDFFCTIQIKFWIDYIIDFEGFNSISVEKCS